MAELTVDDARAALEAHVRTTPWLRRDLASKLSITHEADSGAFEVIFESFTESRGIAPSHEPFQGQDVDGPERGTPPGPWQMHIELPGLFLNRGASFEIPHTASVRTRPTIVGTALFDWERPWASINLGSALPCRAGLGVAESPQVRICDGPNRYTSEPVAARHRRAQPCGRQRRATGHHPLGLWL
jgi:hypothetical protein